MAPSLPSGDSRVRAQFSHLASQCPPCPILLPPGVLIPPCVKLAQACSLLLHSLCPLPSHLGHPCLCTSSNHPPLSLVALSPSFPSDPTAGERPGRRMLRRHLGRILSASTMLDVNSEIPGGPAIKNPLARQEMQRRGFDLWVGKIPWRRKWQPSPVFLLGELHGQRSLGGYSSWGHKELDTTESLNNTETPPPPTPRQTHE